MVTSLNSRTAAREVGYEQVQYIAGRIGPITADTIVRIGTIPAGAVIVAIASRVVTAIAGGTPVLNTGGVAAGIALPANPPTTVNILNVTMAEAAGSELLVPVTQATGPLVQPLATDVDIYATTSGGTTSGDAYIIVQFVKPLA